MMQRRWFERLGARLRRGLVWGLLAGGWSAAMAGDLALITDVAGQPKSGSAPVSVLQYLAEGATLDLAKGDRVVLLYVDSGTEFRLEGPAEGRLAASGPQMTQGEMKRQDLQVAHLGTVQGGSDLRQGAIVLRNVPKSGVHLRYPVDTRISQKLPEFEWDALAGAKDYRVVVTDDQDAEIWSGTVSGTATRLSDKTKLQPGGFYRWRVEARTGDRTVHSDWAEFELLDQKALAELDRFRPKAGDDFSREVLFGLLLEREGADGEAKRLWSRLAAKRPDAPELRERAKP